MIVSRFWRGYRTKGRALRPQKDTKLLESENASGAAKFALVSIRLPVALTFAALVGGLVAGIGGAALGAPAVVSDVAALIGGLWLRALQMTIIPLVAALLVLGLVQMIYAARVGTVARRMLLVMLAVQLAGGAFTSIALAATAAFAQDRGPTRAGEIATCTRSRPPVSHRRTINGAAATSTVSTYSASAPRVSYCKKPALP